MKVPAKIGILGLHFLFLLVVAYLGLLPVCHRQSLNRRFQIKVIILLDRVVMDGKKCCSSGLVSIEMLFTLKSLITITDA